jgi:ABC-type uncharacterized transport system fused permease/ATPase subunit
MSENMHNLKNNDGHYSFYRSSENYIAKVWYDYSNYVTFPLSFIAFRAFTPMQANENISTRLLEGGVLATIAAGVEYGVNNHYLKDYSLSYFPVIGLFLYKQNPVNAADNALNIAVASSGVVLTNYAWQTGNLKYILLPTVSYTVCGFTNVPKPLTIVLTVATTAVDVSLNYRENYATWLLSGTLVTNSIARKLNINPAIALGLGSAAGAILPDFESAILDQLFTPDHFKKSYYAVTEFVNQEKFNLALQHYLIYTVNMELFLGFFGNYFLKKCQELDNQVVAIANQNNPTLRVGEFTKFVMMSISYVLKVAIPYTAFRLAKLSVDIYNQNQIVNLVQKNLLDNLLFEDNFIQGAKSNYTVQSYLKDIETVANDFEVIKLSIFGVPKIIQLGNIDLLTAAGLIAIVVIDSGVSKIFTYLAQLKQSYESQKSKCESAFAKTTAYDKESAVTISQKHGLEYAREKWNKLQQCKHNNALLEKLFDSINTVGTNFYTGEVLYKGLYVLVGYLLNKGGIIQKDELFLYARALQETSNTILFKSKNIATNENVESALNRLNELAELIDSGNNTIATISYEIDTNADALIISNLDFTRGNKEKQIHLHIEKLKLYTGKIYAVTGENGSGKSSITTLLKYVFDHIADLSFNVTGGEIIYPGHSIAMIPQKDYIPFNSSLIGLILHPNSTDNLCPNHEDRIIDFINTLQVLKEPFTVKDLYAVRDDLKDMSGGQKKKLFMIKPQLDCPKVLIMDETFGPLDPSARSLLMDQIKNSCLTESVVLVVWHQDKNEDGTSCVREKFFDYELHVQSETLVLGEVGIDCLY